MRAGALPPLAIKPSTEAADGARAAILEFEFVSTRAVVGRGEMLRRGSGQGGAVITRALLVYFAAVEFAWAPHHGPPGACASSPVCIFQHATSHVCLWGILVHAYTKSGTRYETECESTMRETGRAPPLPRGFRDAHMRTADRNVLQMRPLVRSPAVYQLDARIVTRELSLRKGSPATINDLAGLRERDTKSVCGVCVRVHVCVCVCVCVRVCVCVCVCVCV